MTVPTGRLPTDDDLLDFISTAEACAAAAWPTWGADPEGSREEPRIVDGRLVLAPIRYGVWCVMPGVRDGDGPPIADADTPEAARHIASADPGTFAAMARELLELRKAVRAA